MLTILYGTDWVRNTDAVLDYIAQDVIQKKENRILIVPELISHDMERRLCSVAGDTASRYAEVLSFTRLARRVADSVGHAASECLDNGGRVVAMASAARQLHSKLKAYASVETRPEFLSGLVDAVDEFKRCCITSEDLLRASKMTEGSLAQKLEELSLIMEAYDGICSQGKRDPRDQMNWLLEQLEDSDYAQKHVFYIDGFPDFTRQHMQILIHLIKYSPHVIISLNCDYSASATPGFERAGETFAHILKEAKMNRVSVQLQNIPPETSGLSAVREKILSGTISPMEYQGEGLMLFRADTAYNETIAAVEHILKLVRQGCRYRDISVVCSDMSAYRHLIGLALDRCKIPYYQSGTEDVLQKNVIKTILFALNAALGGLEQQDVLCYMKSMLSPLDFSQADELENYAIIWGISGNSWKKEFANHPHGLNGKWTEKTYQLLSDLNQSRERLIRPLENLYLAFHQAQDLRQQVKALYAFFEEIDLAQRLSKYAEQMDEHGDNRSAQVLNQLWEILVNALEQMYDVLGGTVWEAEAFAHLFKLILSQYDVGTIPAALDAVQVGPVDAMRCQRSEHLIVLGALEGSLPGYGSMPSVLSDQERSVLRELGVPLNGGSMEALLSEFAQIYGVFCGAKSSISVFCPDGQPSFVYKRLLQMTGREEVLSVPIGAAYADRFEAGALTARYRDRSAAQEIGILQEHTQICNNAVHSLGRVSERNIRSLYGERLMLSASQIDRFAECRLSYFLKYGIRADERKPAEVDPAEFGTYVHAVLEQTGKTVMDLGGFHHVSMEKTIQIAREYSNQYIREHFSQIDTQRLSYLFQRNVQELELIVEELWRELFHSDFVPADFELSFGDDGKLPPINIENGCMDACLRGFVDRVDALDLDGKKYFRVVDYKTGKKSFDYCDVFNGIGLQMLLYMFALEQSGESFLGADAIPAGVQYFPARVPLISTDGVPDAEDLAKSRASQWKRKGLLLAQENVLDAMEHDVDVSRLSYGHTKDGALKGDVASSHQFGQLKKYVFRLLAGMIQDIATGDITANPYTRGSSHNACTFCPYDSICHSSDVAQRRNYQKMDPQRFWDEVEKEVDRHGR